MNNFISKFTIFSMLSCAVFNVGFTLAHADDKTLREKQNHADANPDDITAQESVVAEAERSRNQALVNLYRVRTVRAANSPQYKQTFFKHLDDFLTESAQREWTKEETEILQKLGIEKAQQERSRIMGPRIIAYMGIVREQTGVIATLSRYRALKLGDGLAREYLLQLRADGHLQEKHKAWNAEAIHTGPSNEIAWINYVTSDGESFKEVIAGYSARSNEFNVVHSHYNAFANSRDSNEQTWTWFLGRRYQLGFDDYMGSDAQTFGNPFYRRLLNELSPEEKIQNIARAELLLEYYLSADRLLQANFLGSNMEELKQALLQIRARIRSIFEKNNLMKLEKRAFDVDLEFQTKDKKEKSKDLDAAENQKDKESEPKEKTKKRSTLEAVRNLPGKIAGLFGFGSKKNAVIDPATLDAKTREAKETHGNTVERERDIETRQRDTDPRSRGIR